MAESENKIQKDILDYLKKHGLFVWRQNNGSQWDAKLNMYRTHTGLKGVPDILGILPDGRFLGIECKTKTGKQSPDQFLFERRCKTNHGVYILARQVSDVHAIVTEYESR